jgi:hypothetical protein
MGVVEIHDWIQGKRTERGRPTDARPETVTVVTGDVVDHFLGARNERERREHLRDLRDQGKLIHNRNRLTQRVRGTAGPTYVFRGRAADVPRIKRERGRVRWI